MYYLLITRFQSTAIYAYNVFFSAKQLERFMIIYTVPRSLLFRLTCRPLLHCYRRKRASASV